jgi:hypothetical protein
VELVLMPVEILSERQTIRKNMNSHNEQKDNREFEKCVHCGVYTIWKVKGVPVCRSCAKQLEADLTADIDKIDGSRKE